MVVFSGTADRDVREMFIRHVHAERVRPVAEPFQILKANIETARTVVFRERFASACLMRCGDQFTD